MAKPKTALEQLVDRLQTVETVLRATRKALATEIKTRRNQAKRKT